MNVEEVMNGCVLDNERFNFHIKTFIFPLLHDKTGHMVSHNMGLAGVQVGHMKKKIVPSSNAERGLQARSLRRLRQVFRL